MNRAGQTVNYRYNAVGQSIYKQVSIPACREEHYIIDKDQVLGMFKGVSLLYWNIYGNNGLAGRMKVSIPQEKSARGDSGECGGDGEFGGTQKLFYLKDHLGSTRAVRNINGAVVESDDYYPFG